jgi:NhaP-type Na+/H+ or K+/H+ antiporter
MPAWEQLSITKPHLVYVILGGFTSLFMLCSSVIKERLYIGEATIATLCGIIFGPHAANLINPLDWGNTDLITLEFSRIVLVVQCFAVGVELPRAYMEKHWKSVTFLLIPVMTFGWLITSLFIWGLFGSHLNWLDALTIAACVTATDPVLASSVVGKGKFAKRVPKHLRDLLSAESGCNDGMAFPFVYLPLYLIHYRPDANKVAFHWICFTILYECVFGAFYGVMIGYLARRAIRHAHERDIIDRESFLVFYFVLALFCAGSGSLLGLDDLLVGFACGVGFSNDGWFLEKTEESHVSNVIDLLINLAFFVYFGTIIPWDQFNAPIIGLVPWKLVVLGLLVLLFRRIPIMLLCKPLIPDIKTWREALFAGHFGPIGVGGLFVAILARAELETDTTTPLADLPTDPDFKHLNIIEMIWPITCFLVICSILVHGSSIAVFTLGKHINTLTLTLSYTQADENGPSWMERIPRIQSRSKSQMSFSRRPSESSLDEKADSTGPEGLPVLGLKGQFLRRQKEEDDTSRRRRWDVGRGPGGPISSSAIAPRRSDNPYESTSPLQDSDTLAGPSDSSPEGSAKGKGRQRESEEGEGEEEEEEEEEIFQEGHETVIEDEEGNVLGMRESKRNESDDKRNQMDNREARRLMHAKHVEHGVSQDEHSGRAVGEHHHSTEAIKEGVEHPRTWRKRMESFSGRHHHDHVAEPPKAQRPQKRGPALAYQFGNTIIVEDEDGEVLKKYDIPASSSKAQKEKPGRPSRPGLDHKSSVAESSGRAMQSIRRMGTYMGMPASHEEAGPSDSTGAENKKTAASKKKKPIVDEDDDRIRFTVTAGGQRMSKTEFISQMSSMDPKARDKFIQNSDVPNSIKQESRQDVKDATRRGAASSANVPPVVGEEGQAEIHRIESPDAKNEQRKRGPEGLTLVDSDDEDIPFHSVRNELAQHSVDNTGAGETAAQRRRRLASHPEESEQQEPSDETPAERRRRVAALNGSNSTQRPRAPSPPQTSTSSPHPPKSHMDQGETAAERKRRLGALGINNKEDDDETPNSDSDSDAEEAGDPLQTGRGTQSHNKGESSTTAGHGKHGSGAGGATSGNTASKRTPGIRFADQPRVPTKDERAAAEAAQRDEESENASGKKGGLKARLGWKK